MLQVIFAESPLILTIPVFKEQIVICPKLFLFVSTFAGRTSPDGLLSQKCEMDIPQANLPCIDVVLLNLTTRVSGETPAIRSLEIAELDQRDRRIHITNEVAYVGQNSGGNFSC